MSDNKPNYHSFLFRVAPSMDKILEKFKNQESRADVSPHWIGQAIILLLKDLKTFYKPIMKVNEVNIFNLSTLPLIGGVVASAVSFFQGMEWYWCLLILVGAVVILLSLMIPISLTRMLNLTHPHFYLKAYKALRKHEFDLLNHSVHDKNISYQGLAEYVNGVLTKQENELEIVNVITTEYKEEKERLRDEINELRSKEELAIEKYNELIEGLEDEIKWYEDGIQYLVELFHDLHIILHRIGRGKCSFSDLKIIAGYSLYKKNGNVLTRIADEGTTGQNPLTIDLTRNHHNPWVQSTVAAATKQNNLFKIEPKEGYHIVSYRINVGYNNSETWIISLQIVPSVNKKGYLLALTDDIIDQRVIYSMLHGLCQIVYKNTSRPGKGDGTHGK
ncbi:hypothetical protein EKG37_17390 [Robertmurraya yapensis]|uniref:Uncharacterized protein n=1 Tax=Bacillus yapensis TaxID=2492960 RepID=A0A3S0KDD9_9BACI|nr:hypothetical protein [Bacillus yapensis]RTR28077.1 hypothetical protein EKG37_17390 [Bacillus yapensis]TKS94319.1 hypothetical protein FAR12_17390 [Bacillus yapensis]